MNIFSGQEQRCRYREQTEDTVGEEGETNERGVLKYTQHHM